MVHTAVLRIFGSNGSTLLSSDGLSVKDASNAKVLEVTKDKIELKDLSLSSTADEDILFSAKGEKVMSISTDEHVDLGDKNLVHVLEIFTCANNADAGMLAAAIAGGYTIGATYGIVRFQVGVNASDQVWCVRTFSDAQAVKYDVSKMVTTFQGPGAGLAALMTGIEYRILAPASEAAGLAAHYEASGIYDEVPYDPLVSEAQFYKLDSGYNSALSKQNSLIGPVDKCVVTEEFTLGSPHAAAAFAAYIGGSAVSSAGTAGSPLEWSMYSCGNNAYCWRVFADWQAVLENTTAGDSGFYSGLKGAFPTLSSFVAKIQVPADVTLVDAQAALDLTGNKAAALAEGVTRTDYLWIAKTPLDADGLAVSAGISPKY